MPLTTPSTYLPAIESLLNHWAEVNQHIGGGGLTLPGGYNRGHLAAAKNELAAIINEQRDSLNEIRLAATDRDLLKQKVHQSAKKFLRILRAQFEDPLNRGEFLPNLPQVSNIESRFFAPIESYITHWRKINALPPDESYTPPLILPGGQTLARFETETATLRADYDRVRANEATTRLNLARREELIAAIRPKLINYRRMVAAKFPPESALVTTLPKLSLTRKKKKPKIPSHD